MQELELSAPNFALQVQPGKMSRSIYYPAFQQRYEPKWLALRLVS